MEGRFLALDCDRVKGGQLTMPIGQRVVLIGGGHNALITAFLSCQGGFKSLVLERREMVARRHHRGISSRLPRVHSRAHPRPLRADVARDLQLDNFDCEILYPDPRVFAPTLTARRSFSQRRCQNGREIARISAKDSAKYAQFALSLEKTADFFTKLTSITPPAIDKPTPEDLW